MYYNGQSDVGKIRKTNQDSFDVFEIISGAVVAVVCDGMGGVQGGEFASFIATQEIAQYIKNEFVPNIPIDKTTILVKSAIESANEKVFNENLLDVEKHGMGTTAVVALVFDKLIICGHVGDSRIYLIENESITRITKDHSIVQELVDEGVINAEEAKVHPRRNIITRAIGTKQSIDVDTYVLGCEEGNILLCSDGLTEFVNDDEIAKIVREHKDKSPQILIDLANERGGGDNITVVIVCK